MAITIAVFTKGALPFVGLKSRRATMMMNLKGSRFYCWNRVVGDELLCLFLLDEVKNLLCRWSRFYKKKLAADRSKTVVKTLQEFHSAVASKAFNHRLTSAANALFSRNNEVQFVPERFETGEICSNREVLLLQVGDCSF